MQNPAPVWLTEFIAQIQPMLRSGEVSRYLPELAAAENSDFGIALYGGEGDWIAHGLEHRFTIQSVVKVITLLLAIEQQGLERTFGRSGCDQSYAPYDSILNYDQARSRTANPFVNAGALVTLDSLEAEGAEGLVAKVLDSARFLTGNPELSVNMSVAESEYLISDRNRSIAYHLASHKAITHPVDELLWAYCQICSIEVNVLDLARFSYLLSQQEGIVSPVLELSAEEVSAVRRLLLAVGMYEASAEYACTVGVPSKCGVSGAMMAILPSRGIGIYGPALDTTGNSAGGVAMMRLLARRFKVI